VAPFLAGVAVGWLLGVLTLVALAAMFEHGDRY
jgi:hypothetical protein